MIELFCDDFRNIIKAMAEEGIKVDCILADPPYGVSNNSWDVPFDFQEMWELLSKITKEKLPFYFLELNRFLLNCGFQILRIGNMIGIGIKDQLDFWMQIASR